MRLPLLAINSIVLICGLLLSVTAYSQQPHSTATFKMNIGLNSNWVSSWDSSVYFSNIARQLGRWEYIDVTRNGNPVPNNNFSQYRGKLTARNSNDVFRAYLSDKKIGLKQGQYTVRWTGVGAVGVGGYFPEPKKWDSSGQFTFEITSKGSLLSIWFKGEYIDSLEVVHQDHLASYDSGNEWNPDYLEFIKKTGSKIIRTMNWGKISETPESTWQQRAVSTDISYQKSVPIEVMADFAKRTGINIWWNIPIRATNNYIFQAGQLWNKLLPTDSILYVEYGNEVWNYAWPWGGETNWIKFAGSTRFIANVDPKHNILNMPNHQLKTGDKITCFKSFDDYMSDVDMRNVWFLTNGNQATITVIDKDNFYVNEYGSKNKATLPYNQKKLIYIKQAGAVDQLNTQFVARNEAAWDQLEKSIDRSRMKYILATWTNSPSMTKERVNALKDKGRVDGVALAFYYGGGVLAAQLNQTKNQLQPKVIGGSAYFALYESSAKPSTPQVMAGDGALASEYFEKVSINKYTSGSKVTGLKLGKKYKAIFVFETKDKLLTRIETTYQQGVDPISGQYTSKLLSDTIFESNAQHLIRERYGIQKQADYIRRHKAVTAGIPIVGYEGGLAFDFNKPKDVDAFYESYSLSKESALSTKEFLATLAGEGVTDFNWYKDVSITSFRTAKFISNPMDYGPYRQFVEQKGIATSKGNAIINNQDAIFVEQYSKPVSKTTVIHDFKHDIANVDADTYRYDIIAGNQLGLFKVSLDGKLTLSNPEHDDINWSYPNIYTITLRVFNGESYTMSKVQIKLWDIGKVVYFNKAKNSHIKFSEGPRSFAVGDTIEFDFWLGGPEYNNQPFTDSYFIDYQGYDFLLHPSGHMVVKDSFKVTIDGQTIPNDFLLPKAFPANSPHHMVIEFLKPQTDVRGTLKRHTRENGITGVIRNLKLTQSGIVTQWKMDSGAHGNNPPTNQEQAVIGEGMITYVNVEKSDWTQ